MVVFRVLFSVSFDLIRVEFLILSLADVVSLAHVVDQFLALAGFRGW
jgi:hypothetical protein